MAEKTNKETNEKKEELRAIYRSVANAFIDEMNEAKTLNEDSSWDEIKVEMDRMLRCIFLTIMSEEVAKDIKKLN